jgi:hypothetical protein
MLLRAAEASKSPQRPEFMAAHVAAQKIRSDERIDWYVLREREVGE